MGNTYVGPIIQLIGADTTTTTWIVMLPVGQRWIFKWDGIGSPTIEEDAPSTSTASWPGAPNATAEQCIRFADMIDNRLEAVGGRTADTLAAFLRRVAAELTRFAEAPRDPRGT